ncbi:MAG: isocitrate lyase/phosphoenolpyruvate mutase family protein, partial [Betaproteobacteria bacterium]
MTQGKQLRQLLATQKPIMPPGAADGLSARLIQAAGFPAIYAVGGAIARVAGYPDIGKLQLSEVLDRVKKIVNITSLPVMVDADTDFGGLGI